MSIVYEDGVLSKIRFTNEPEAKPKHHWYEVGTRIIFAKAVKDSGQAITVQVTTGVR